MELSLLIEILLFAFLCSKLGTYFTIRLAKQQHFYEENNVRKIHVEKVSALGGIPIFLTFGLSSAIFIKSSYSGYAILLACLLLLGIGLWDDLKNIGIKRRLLTQFLVANIAYLVGFQFMESGIPPLITYGLTIGFIVLMINGMNFLDGINGLAGGIGLIAASVFALIFYTNGQFELAIMALAYAGALMGFLWYNFGKKAAIFMGDNGSTILGFLLAIFTLKVWNLSMSLTIYTNLIPISFALIALPILDLFGVVVVRLSNKQSPFQADRTHIHHLLTDSGKSHVEASCFLFTWMLSLTTIFYFELINSMGFAIVLIIGTYLAIRLFFTAIKSPSISGVKWDKPAPQPTPAP